MSKQNQVKAGENKKTSFLAMLLMGALLGARVASAEIVYDDFGGTPKTYSFGTTAIPVEDEQSIEFSLPGDGFRFNSFYHRDRNFIQYVGPEVHRIQDGAFSFVVSALADQTWSDVNGSSIATWANLSTLSTTTFHSTLLRANPTYIPFRFEDKTDSDTWKYGYVKLSTEVSGSGVDSVLTLKVYSYAYETDGSGIKMGAVGSPVGGVSVTAWPTASAITYGDALSESTLAGGTASVDGSFDFTSSAIVPNAGTSNQSVTFWPANPTLHNAVVGSVPVLVYPKALTVTADAQNKTFGQADLTFTYLVSGLVGTNTAASVLSGTLSRDAGENVGTYAIIQGTLAANTNYSLTFIPARFTINKADQVIDFPAIAAKPVSAPVALEATASSGLPVAFTVVDGPGALDGVTLSFSALGAVRVIATQAGNANWNSAVPATNSISVYALTASNGPAAGGNSVTMTYVDLDSVTNVLVGGVSATITAQGADWVTITMPVFGVEGPQDIVLQASDSGDMKLAGVYTVNPAGVINIPKFIASGGPYLSGGDYHSMALKADGSIAAWGYTDYGQLVVPTPNSGFVAVSAGAGFSMGLKANGTITAWGRNFDRQATVPAPNTNFVAISAGDIHSLGLKADGSVVCWGTNTLGQLIVPAPNSGFVAVAAGYSGYSLGLKSDGRIVGWGRNDYGQTAVPAPNTNFVAMAAGHRHALGLKADGTIALWGNNAYGQLDLPAPNSDFVAIAAGALHSLGLKSDGTIVAWGSNISGQLNVPAPNGDFVAVAVGNYHSLGLKADGTIVSWGDNKYGALNVPDSVLDFGLFEYGVTPSFGAYTGGYEVVISGTNLCDGTTNDIISVTLCGVTSSVVSVSGSTQIVVRAGVATTVGRGDVRVVSTSFGATVQGNAFTYQRAEQAPLIFEPITPQAYRVKNVLSTSGGSGTGAVSYRVISGPGTILNRTQLYVSAGSGTITVCATKAQDGLFYATSADATVEAIRGTAILTLRDLIHTYDGTPKRATVTTDPSGMPVDLTYDGSATPPTEVGSYDVLATVDLENWIGSTNGTLTIQLLPSVVQQIQLNTDGSVALTFTTVPGLEYVIQYCDSLSDEWQDAGSNFIATAAVTSWTDSGPPETSSHPQHAPSRFYRIVILQRM